MSSIYILSGPVHSGKTGRLMNWIKNNSGVTGIIAPTIDGQRYLKDIADGEMRPLEIPSADDKDAQKVGRYTFSVDTFRWAVEVIEIAISNQPDWLIIDEVGPLELTGKGLSSAVNCALQNIGKTNLALIIRDTLINDVIDHYHLDRGKIKEFTF